MDERPGAIEERGAAYNRRAVLKASAGLGAVALAGRARHGAAQEAPPAASPAAGACLIPSPMAGVPDAYRCSIPTFRSVTAVPGDGSTVRTLQISYSPPVPPRGENLYWQELEKRLGVTLEPDLVPAPNYVEKIGVATAGGELPDLTTIWLPNAADQARAIQQGAYTDLTDDLTGDALVEYPNLAAFPDYVWRNVMIGGRIYGVPRPRTQVNEQLAFRQDWLDRLGLAQPRNAEEFLQIMVAFTQGDPDGNGQADTWGLGSGGGVGSASFFFFDMFRVPNGWRLNPDGTLTNQVETEEYRQAISFMRRLYEAGVCHPEFLTMNVAQARDLLVAGRFGAFLAGLAGFVGPAGLRLRAKQVAPEANLVALLPPGHDGGQTVKRKSIGFFAFVAIPTQIGGDQDRLRERFRILNYVAAPFGSEESVFLTNGIEGVHHEVAPDGSRVRTELGNAEIGDLPNLMNGAPVFYFPETPGDAEYLQGVVRDSMAIGIDNPTLGLISETDLDKGGELAQFVSDGQTAIVAGREPTSAWDQVVSGWRSRGGDQIRREYEEALAKQ